MNKKVFAVVYTDRWDEDHLAQEIYLDKSLAEARVAALNQTRMDINGEELISEDYYYVTDELPLIDG